MGKVSGDGIYAAVFNELCSVYRRFNQGLLKKVKVFVPIHTLRHEGPLTFDTPVHH